MFTEISGTKLKVQSFGKGTNGRIIAFTCNGNGRWEKVDHANILIVGQDARRELKRLLNQRSKSQIIKLIPGGLSSGTLTALRKHLNEGKEHGRPPQHKPTIER